MARGAAVTKSAVGAPIWLRAAFVAYAFALWLSASAAVQRVELTQVDQLQEGRSFGAGGAYQRIVGRAYFAVDPVNPANRRITDIALAPRNALGLVEFSADFVVLRPVDPEKARGVVIEIPNRGNTAANGWLFTTAPGSRFQLPELKDVSFDDAFALEQGFTLVWIGWQFDLPTGSIGIRVPVAPVHGPVRVTLIASGEEAGISLSRPSRYCAADAVQAGAVATVRVHFDDRGRVLPRSAWSFAREEGGRQVPDPCSIYVNGGFERGKLYEFVYQGAEPPLAGLGLAAVRDFASFLKYGSESAEPSEVLRKHPQTLQRVLGYGYSQSGRFLREFLYKGFNADEHGRRAFDALFVASAGGGRGSFDHRYAMPGEAGNSVLGALRPVDLFPFCDELESDPLGHLSDGLLAAEERSNTMPKIFYTYSSTEFWARVGSLAITTVDGTKNLPLNASSRLYFFAGTAHAPGPFPPTRTRRNPKAMYAYSSNFSAPWWAFRALLLDLDDWVSEAAEPPPSVYPHLPRDLVPRNKVRFPNIPDVSFPPYLPINWRMNYGPNFRDSGVIALEPPKLAEPYRILVPQVDRDGNDVGGIRLPEVAVPLGTSTGWNYELPSLPDFQYLGGLVGSFLPFPKTRAEREATGDPRLSIEERYPTRDGYLEQVRAAAESLVAQRLLRREDIEALIRESAEQWDYLTRKDAS